MADLHEFRSKLEKLSADFHDEIAQTHGDQGAYEGVKNRYWGRTSGVLSAMSGSLATLSGEDRAQAGKLWNEKRAEATHLLALYDPAKVEREAAPSLDLSMPARHAWRGAVHPVSQVIDEIADVFRALGFTIALGPEAESPWYNFGALNFPDDHPAMDMHDTLYLQGEGLLRTHTSPVQVRTMQAFAPPVRILAPGNVYRRDFFDATHAPAFSQLEGLAIDEGISFADLKATLTHFARAIYGGRTRTRFIPSFFPFTEPSAQMDVLIDLADGRGERWVEIMGCGLVHPAVLESVGVDSERYSGWAFGMGPGRIAMSRFGITDIRLLYDSDVRFLEQFA